MSNRDIELVLALIDHPGRSAVAETLGVSERHLRRLISSLLERLAVRTTHAAVVLAVSEGYVPPEAASRRRPQEV